MFFASMSCNKVAISNISKSAFSSLPILIANFATLST